jgi:DNA-binding response OmpR family regulator
MERAGGSEIRCAERIQSPRSLEVMVMQQPRNEFQPRIVAATRSGRILVAEDDDEMRSLLASCLSKDGHEVVQAADGEELVDIVTRSLQNALPIDLVISDVRMPGLNGFEAVEWLRALGCRAPVILITAFGDRRTHLDGVRLGVVRVLDKPFELDELRTLARQLFERRGRGGRRGTT